MKKLISAILVVTMLLSLATVASAAPGGEREEKSTFNRANQAISGEENPDDAGLNEERPEGEKPVGERPEGERPVGGDITSLYETYYPEGLAAFTSLQADHDAFHAGRDADRDAFVAERDALKALLSEKRDELIAAVEAGEMTQEEAHAEMEAYRAEQGASTEEVEAIKAGLEAIKADKSADGDALKAQADAAKSVLQAALQSEPVDESAVASALATLTDILSQHISMDNAYAEQIDALLGE